MMHLYLFVLLGLVSFAAMGIIHKLGDRCDADPLSIAIYAMIAAGLLSGLRALMMHTISFHPLPPRILLIALPFGASAGLGLWVFQKGLRYGHIATSWLLINLSAGIPTVLSIVFYHEQLGWKKTMILLLVVISLLLLWWDRRNVREDPEPAPPTFTTEAL